ncbi:Uncharacterized protein Adt_36310 [Abeliophyllum distichum]|uniref:DUF6570 domain-containing protein n=1 Tax=Abeliophyllum distichum TaxID=126358 RepID=A0ABD1QI37_9LAMI
MNSIANVLLFKPADLSTILIVNRTGANAIKQFCVRRKYVRQALVWLKQNHFYYRDITIDELFLETLLEDGIPVDMPHAHENNAQFPNENESIDVVEDDIEGPPEIVNQNVQFDEFHAVGTIFIGPQRNQQACIQMALYVADADHTIKKLMSFPHQGYISMVFPALFLYRNADFRQARLRKNSISRWRAFSLGDVYVKKNPSDTELSIQDIQNMVASGDTRLAGRISYYAKSIL